MLKLVVIVSLVAVAASSVIPAVPVVSHVVSPVISPVVSSQRAIIHHSPHHGYGHGHSARYYDRADYGHGLGVYGVGIGGVRAHAPRYHGAVGNVIDGIDNLGLAYNNYDLNDGRILGLGLGHLGYGFGHYGHGIGL